MSSLSTFISLFSVVTLWAVWASGEPRYLKRYDLPPSIARNVSELFANANVDPVLSASEYLGKFGWVEPKDWVSISPRLNSTNEEPSLDRERIQVREEETASNATEGVELPEKEFSEALRNFQLANDLEVTGKLDKDTLTKMSQVRCGVPDQTKRNLSLSYFTQDFDQLRINNAILAFLGRTAGSSSENMSVNSSDESELLFSHFSTEVNATERSRKRREVLAGGRHKVAEYLRDLIRTSHENKGVGGDERELGYVTITEGELAEQSRVESIESVLAALRKEKLQDVKGNRSVSVLDPSYGMISNPPSSPESLLTRLQTFSLESQLKRRRKRSNVPNRFRSKPGWGMAFAKRRITWRLVREWPSNDNPFMSRNEIWFTVKLAFRMWSEILPRVFEEDNVSPANNVDILIGFGEGRHNRCPVKFNTGTFVSEYAHAWPLPKAEIHFNDGQAFVPVSWKPTNQRTRTIPFRGVSANAISLLKVAKHEIGHSLGLPHSDNPYSIMNPYYQPYKSKNIVEIGRHDRDNIKRIYGACDLPFDVVFDWVRQERGANGVKTWKYNTYFFRHTWYWLYENRVQRPRYGDPKLTSQYWKGLLQPHNDPHRRLDGAVHIRSWANPAGRTFFFKGDVFIEYDNDNDRAFTHDSANNSYPRRISEGFPGVPYPIDTVFFHLGEQLLYFFKNNVVYRFHWASKRILDSALISTAFPGWGGAAPLANNLDAAYYSNGYNAYYFFKGSYYWKLAGPLEKRANPNIRFPYNSVGPKQRVISKWKDICDVGASELVLTLPNN